MARSGLVQKSGNKHLTLKPTARTQVRSWLESILTKPKPEADQEQGFLPKSVWAGTRGYVERIAEQINSSYEFDIHDGTAVLCRRLMETLLIECYEESGRTAEIKDANNDFLMLRDIIAAAVSTSGLGLSRDVKKHLPKIKELGDRSAHNRRYTAKKADLDKIESAFRLVAEELVEIASLK